MRLMLMCRLYIFATKMVEVMSQNLPRYAPMYNRTHMRDLHNGTKGRDHLYINGR
jgi:hypothetical protein